MKQDKVIVPIRVTREQRSLWRVAAAKSDMGVGQWILSRLGVVGKLGEAEGWVATDKGGATPPPSATPPNYSTSKAKPTPTPKPCMLCKREVTDWVVVNGFYVCAKCFNKQA